jgi:hypothetical protein
MHVPETLAKPDPLSFMGYQAKTNNKQIEIGPWVIKHMLGCACGGTKELLGGLPPPRPPALFLGGSRAPDLPVGGLPPTKHPAGGLGGAAAPHPGGLWGGSPPRNKAGGLGSGSLPGSE